MIVLPRPVSDMATSRFQNLTPRLSISRLIDPPSPGSSTTSPSEASSAMTTMTTASPCSVYSPSPNFNHKQPVLRYYRPASLLERLPVEVQSMILDHLDYQSLIFLSATSKPVRDLVDPQTAPLPEKMRFIMRAAKDFPQHRPSEKGQDFKPGNFECYVCFRVREPDHFDTMQASTAWVDRYGSVVRNREVCGPRGDREVHLRRFCIECGVKTWLHQPFDCLTTKTGRDLWICLCRRVWAKPGTLRCTDCGADCPLRPRKR